MHGQNTCDVHYFRKLCSLEQFFRPSIINKLFQTAQFTKVVHVASVLAMHSIVFNYFFQVFVPMHINNHWALVVLDFIKTEVQILNSLASNPAMRDEGQEKTLVSTDPLCNTCHLFNYSSIKLNMYLTIHQVEGIQSCIDSSVKKDLNLKNQLTCVTGKQFPIITYRNKKTLFFLCILMLYSNYLCLCSVAVIHVGCL